MNTEGTSTDGMSTDGANLLARPRPDAWIASASAPDARRLNVLRAWFYLGVPLLLGFLLGWLGVGRTTGWPVAVSLVYWIGLSLAAVWAQTLGSMAVSALLRPRGAPLWFVLIAGQLLAGYVLLAPFVGVLLTTVAEWLPPGTHVITEGSPLAMLAKRLPSNATLWLGLNLLFFYGLKMPRFGYVPPSRDREREVASPPVPTASDRSTTGTAATAQAAKAAEIATACAEPRVAAAPTFLSRMRAERRGTCVLALRAEGHYLRVYTDAGSDLVLFRLSDAIVEMADEPGARVHRSWWVAERALSTERHGDRVRLVNGVDVPVSRSYRVAARQRGWLAA
jgi:hypothetical protein